MGTIITRFEYASIEEALHFSSYYADILTSYNNKFDSLIITKEDGYLLEFKIYEQPDRRKNNNGNRKRTRHLPESSAEDSQDPV